MKAEICKLCNKEYIRIATHLKRTHNIRSIDYYKKHDRDKYLLELQFNFINDFYITYRRQYIIMNYNRQIATVNNTLTDSTIKTHIRQKNRIGIKFSKSGSNIIGFDIDSLDIDNLESVYETLINYNIPRNAILTTFSGNKGYHVDIFLDNYIDRKMIQSFYKIILEDTGYSTTQIELRGGSDDGYFLPFGINFKGLSNYNYGYCGIVNHLGVMENDTEKEIEVLEQMQKADINIIKDIVMTNIASIRNIETVKATKNKVDDVKALEEVNSTLETLKLLDIYNTSTNDVIAQIGQRKEIEQGTRHKLAFVYAIALRDIYSQDGVYNQLLMWHQNLTSGYKSSWKEIEQDCKDITKSVFIKQGLGYKYNLPNNSRPFITKSNITEFASVKSVADRRVYLALSIHSNTFKDDEGNFYMTYEQIKEMLGLQARNKDILTYLKRLEENGYIYIVSRNNREKGQSKHKPNIYKLNDAEVQEQEVYYLKSNNRIDKTEITDAVDKLFTTREFRSIFKNKTNFNKVMGCLIS